MPILHDEGLRLNATAFVSGEKEDLPVYRFNGAPGGDSIEIVTPQRPERQVRGPSSPPTPRGCPGRGRRHHVSPSGIDSGCHPEQVAREADHSPAARPRLGHGRRPRPAADHRRRYERRDDERWDHERRQRRHDETKAARRTTTRAVPTKVAGIAGKPKLAGLTKGLTVTVAGATGKVALSAQTSGPPARRPRQGRDECRLGLGEAAGGTLGAPALHPKGGAQAGEARRGPLRITRAGVATTATLKR